MKKITIKTIAMALFLTSSVAISNPQFDVHSVSKQSSLQAGEESPCHSFFANVSVSEEHSYAYNNKVCLIDYIAYKEMILSFSKEKDVLDDKGVNYKFLSSKENQNIAVVTDYNHLHQVTDPQLENGIFPLIIARAGWACGRSPKCVAAVGGALATAWSGVISLFD